MPKQAIVESRSDFRGGLNTAVSPDMLNPNELVQATNARLTTPQAAIAKRTGSKRMHAAAIGAGAAVMGLVQWDSPGGKQLVAVAGGKLYHKTTELGAFTEIVPGTLFSTTVRTSFATIRQSTTGAPLRLYLADGNVYRFDGTTLTEIDGTNSVPAADLYISYHTRAFARRTDLKKHVFWGKIGNPEDFRTGGVADGGSGLVDVLTGEDITAFEVVGSSLLIATGNSIVRFTGYSNEDIQIAQDTEGVSPEVGIVGKLALLRVETFAIGVSERGPYAIVEAGAQPIGVKVEPEFDALDRTVLGNIAIGYHRGRREVWIAVPGASDTALNKTVYVYSTRLNAWFGPFTYNFGITCFARYQDANGDEFLIAGCSDGFVRHMDIGALDDVLSDGTGGSVYTMTVELAPFFFPVGPGALKALRRGHVQANITAGAALKLGIATDDSAFTDYNVVFEAAGVQSHRVDLGQQGGRIRARFTDASSTTTPTVNGLTLEAYDYNRIA